MDEAVRSKLSPLLTMDANGLMTSKEVVDGDISEYGRNMSTRNPKAQLTEVEVEFLCKTWQCVNAYLRSELCKKIVVDNALPMMQCRQLLDFHMSVLTQQRPEVGVYNPFAKRLNMFTKLMDEVFCNRTQTSVLMQGRLKERHKGVTIPNEVVFFWMTMLHFGDTLRTIKVCRKPSFGTLMSAEVQRNKSPVTLMCLHGQEMLVNEYALYCEDELMFHSVDVTEALFMYVSVWFMLNLKIDGFPQMDEDRLVATHSSQAQSQSQVPSASQSQSNVQIPSVSQTQSKSQSQSQSKCQSKSQRKAHGKSQSKVQSKSQKDKDSQSEDGRDGEVQPLQRLTSTITFLGKMLLNVQVPMPVGKEHTTTRNNIKHAMKRFSYHVMESNLAAEKMCD